MQARRSVIEPGTAGPAMRLTAQEALVYVAAGDGTAEAGGERFVLGPESVLWLASCDEVSLRAGAEGLDALVAESAAVPRTSPA